jgi:hypothetical protein
MQLLSTTQPFCLNSPERAVRSIIVELFGRLPVGTLDTDVFSAGTISVHAC